MSQHQQFEEESGIEQHSHTQVVQLTNNQNVCAEALEQHSEQLLQLEELHTYNNTYDKLESVILEQSALENKVLKQQEKNKHRYSKS